MNTDLEAFVEVVILNTKRLCVIIEIDLVLQLNTIEPDIWYMFYHLYRQNEVQESQES